MVKRHDENGLDPANLVIGRQSVLEALSHGILTELYLQEGLKGEILNAIVTLARENKVFVKYLSRSKLDRLTGGLTSHQGVAARAKPYSYLSLKELISAARESGSAPFLLLLDHLQDPQNLGSIIRTADAAGVHGLVIPEKRSVRVTAAVRKVAAGAAERTKIALINNLSRAIEELKKEGFWVYGTEANGPHSFYDADYAVPLALVVGSEGKGLSRLVRENCDRVLHIPMKGTAGSLNASVASALVIYAAASQREGWR